VPVHGDATEAGEDGEKQVVGSSLMLLKMRLAFAGPARGDSITSGCTEGEILASPW
jgi:hypothetical protein